MSFTNGRYNSYRKRRYTIIKYKDEFLPTEFLMALGSHDFIKLDKICRKLALPIALKNVINKL